MSKSNAQTMAPVYAVEGVLKQTATQEGRGALVELKAHWDFKLLADEEGRWKMELHKKSSDAKLPIESTEHLAYDGTNIYQVVYSPQVVETGPGARRRMSQETRTRGAGCISSGPFPLDHGGTVGALWFAFFGGNYLDASTNRGKFPNLLLGDARIHPAAWSCQLAYKLIPNSQPRVIQEGDFFLEPELLRNDSAAYPEMNEPVDQRSFADMRNVFARCKALKGDALLRSKYVLEETHTFRGRQIPKKFKADCIALDSSDISVRLEGEITKVVEHLTAVDIRPPVDGAIASQDRRFRLKETATWRGGIHYMLESDGWIVDPNNPRIKTILGQTPMRPILNQTILRDYGKGRRTCIKDTCSDSQ